MARLLSFRRALSPSTWLRLGAVTLLVSLATLSASAWQTPGPAVEEAPAATDPIEEDLFDADPFDAADAGEPMVDEGDAAGAEIGPSKPSKCKETVSMHRLKSIIALWSMCGLGRLTRTMGELNCGSRE